MTFLETQWIDINGHSIPARGEAFRAKLIQAPANLHYCALHPLQLVMAREYWIYSVFENGAFAGFCACACVNVDAHADFVCSDRTLIQCFDVVDPVDANLPLPLGAD